LAAVALSAAMAVVSNFNAHPDEVHHFEAVKWYASNHLPPEIGDPAARESYSVWGVSYLNFQWIEYFLTGKFVSILTPVTGDPLRAARAFQVLLFFTLAACFAVTARKRPSQLIFAGILLITPQPWYIFSYVNNDAFALFVSILICHQAAADRSALGNFLDGSAFRTGIWGGAGFGILLGLQMIGKTNYWIIPIFSGLLLFTKRPPSLANAGKYAFIGLVALSVLGFRVGLDLHVNGETNFSGLSYVNYLAGNPEAAQNKLAAYQEEVAAPEFKPSRLEGDPANSPSHINLKAKGKPLSSLVTEMDWHRISFRSFAGGYGYMKIFASDTYYGVIALLYIAFAIYVMVAVLRSGEITSIAMMIVSALCAAITVLVSLYLSWTYAFQAQGRYLFPILPIAATMIYVNRSRLDDRITHAFIFACFLLSVYSFVLVALPNINHQ
jgi:hypothetical protein